MERQVDDVRFVSALLDDLGTHVAVDEQRIYATGISNGGLMSFLLAAHLSDRIAAVAPISGQLGLDAVDAPPRAVPIIYFHGLADEHAQYQGGYGPRSMSKTNFAPVVQVISGWAAHHGCPAAPTSAKTIGMAVMSGYGPCRDGSEVVLWTLKDGGHTWPGGRMSEFEERLGLGHINRDIAASEVMWEFFERHPMPRTWTDTTTR
jgi:polyhydroxybutyrate depolymerase